MRDIALLPDLFKAILILAMNANQKSQAHALSSNDTYFDLGKYSRKVTTSSVDAEVWFNRGLIWCYGFNHEEAAICFEQAIAHDSTCALAYWGLAYALGPNYNKPWDVFDGDELGSTVARTHAAVVQAEAHAGDATPVEQALIRAIEFRYPESEPGKDLSIWNQQYAEAMENVYSEFPDDLDVTALYVDALMNLMPWKLWDIKTKQPTDGAPTLKILEILQKTFDLPPALSHPGLLHLWIHFKEMSPDPETALPIADHLRGLVPDAGHLQHMPSHLDILGGDYRRAIASNIDAFRADEKFLEKRGCRNFYTLYRCHDYHFAVYAAMLAGQSKVALEVTARLESTLPENVLRIESPPMADWLESFLSLRVHVLIRFGKWHDLLALKMPQDTKLYCNTTSMYLYGKGVASAALSRDDDAQSYRKQFLAAAQLVPETRTLFNNKCVDILSIAQSMLDGEIEYRLGNFDVAFEHLRSSIHKDDTLPYDEPWGWMQPTRHAYGALLLEQERIQEAANVYFADLGFNDTLPRQLQHLNNVWALHGLHECLLRLDRRAEASILEPQLKLALAYADVEITSSCFCRLNSV